MIINKYKGAPLPAEEFVQIYYALDVKHYLFARGPGERLEPADPKLAQQIKKANRTAWGEEVDVSDRAYKKLSPKPRTLHKVAVGKIGCYNIFTKECVALTPSVWAGCSDRTQSKRYYRDIQQQLGAWFPQGKPICAGVADGGFYHEELQQRMRWVTPVPKDAIARLPEAERPWVKSTNAWIRLVRGPNSETRFADQTNKLGMIRRKFRLGMQTFDVMLAIAEALMNIDRRLKRKEEVGEKTGAPVTAGDIMYCSFFEHAATRLDDMVALGNYEEDEEEEEGTGLSPFQYVDENNVPIALRCIFTDPASYIQATRSPIGSREQHLGTIMSVEEEREEEEMEEAEEEDEEREDEEEEEEESLRTKQKGCEKSPFAFEEEPERRPKKPSKRVILNPAKRRRFG